MKSGIIQILDIDFEYKLWKNKLVYYKLEIELLIDRSRVLTKECNERKLSRQDAMLLSLQLDIVKSLLNKIRSQELEMALYAEDYPITRKHTHFYVHEKIREEIEKTDIRHQEIMDTIYKKLCFPMCDTEDYPTEIKV